MNFRQGVKYRGGLTSRIPLLRLGGRFFSFSRSDAMPESVPRFELRWRVFGRRDMVIALLILKGKVWGKDFGGCVVTTLNMGARTSDVRSGGAPFARRTDDTAHLAPYYLIMLTRLSRSCVHTILTSMIGSVSIL